jgi:hypothetical protein
MEAVNVVGIEFTDNGRSLRLELVESLPPYAGSFLTCTNACCVKLYKCGADEFPLVVVDLSWGPVCTDAKARVLMEHGYPIEDEFGAPLPAARPLAWARFEGALVGDVLADEILLTAR